MRQKVNPTRLLTIVGPTASGKTDLALKLAKKFKGLVISADSRQLYKHAAIGTNQPVGQWLIANSKWPTTLKVKKIYVADSVPHFFIDTLSPTKTYSAAQFQIEVNNLCHKLSATSYRPILVGGTGLYVSSLTEGYKFPQVKTNVKLRKALAKQTTPKLLGKLKKLDPETYGSIDKNNRRRLIRALEYILTSGQSFLVSQSREPRPNTLIIGLNPPKTKLRLAIAKRTQQMLNQGLLEETRLLMKHYPSSILLKTIGYKEVVPVLQKQRSLAEAQALINNHTWQYARRQLTWFKKMPNVKWVKNYVQAEKFFRCFISNQSNS